MLKEKHNSYSKEFLKKINMFIDSILLNGLDDTKSCIKGLISIKEAILTEIVIDNQVVQFNNFLREQENNKKKEIQKDLEEIKKDSSQEKKLEQGPKV